MTIAEPRTVALPKQVTKSPEDKLRGGYYTSLSVADWLTRWAIRSPNDRILEPSCGDGVFLASSAIRLLSLGAHEQVLHKQITGIEISPTEALHSAERLRPFLRTASEPAVYCQDFFTWHRDNESTIFSAVVGNPPFIRYQNFPEPSRSLAMAVMQHSGLRPNMLTNIWVPFVVGSMLHLAHRGRMGMVIPAELLQVTYAAQLRGFLLDRFDTIDIIACNELFFPGAQQEVVLLLADGYEPEKRPAHKCHIDLFEIPAVNHLAMTPVVPNGERRRAKCVKHDTEKWLKYFLSPYEISFMRRLRRANQITTLKSHATVDVGVVTGNNDFFVISREAAAASDLSADVSRIIGRSAQLRGAKIEQADWEILDSANEKIWLLNLDRRAELNSSAKKYVSQGEAALVHLGYKCSIRKPWYFIPAYWVPEAFLFRQIYDFPRPVLNLVNATSTDTVHRMKFKSSSKAVVAAMYTHLTGASAEIVGRSYGGGVLELEPTEAEHLLVPANISATLPLDEIDQLVRAGRLADALDLNGRVILQEGVGLSKRECSTLQAIWSKMRGRRLARRKASPKN